MSGPAGHATRLPRLAVALLVAGLVTAVDVAAQVELRRLPDGSHLLTNSGVPRRPPVRAARPEIERLIELQARRQRLDPKLVSAVVHVESGFDPAALSRRGAMGLMQLMPATARSLDIDDPYDPEQNLRGGTAYLRRMLDRFGGNLELALASYNAGPQAVERHRGLPPYTETHAYVDRVLRLFRGQGMVTEARFDIGVARGRPTFLSRDASGRLVMSTSPPGR